MKYRHVFVESRNEQLGDWWVLESGLSLMVVGFWKEMGERRKGEEEEDGLDEAERRCHRFACEIQTCLSRNSYQESRCRYEINAFNQCVANVRHALQLPTQPPPHSNTSPTTTNNNNSHKKQQPFQPSPSS
mmetsp:Transcript_2027/g.4483  ORF Transcript_2027/g.4483 Transcript_2027/m.4483 type:complete len:131 (+) Transcript_2027:688-1080(+)